MPTRTLRSPDAVLRTLAVVLVVLAAAALASATAAAMPSSSPRATASHPAAAAPPLALDAPQLDSGNPPITFDEVDVGTVVTDQYADQGVVFTSDVFTTGDASNPTSPVLSGDPLFTGDITASFVTPGTTTPTTVNGFSLDVGYIDNRSSVVVDYFDSHGDVVGSQWAQSFGINHLTITYRGIAGFSVYAVEDEPAGFAIDNLIVDPTVSTPVTSVASMGDSYSSGEGRLDGRYDCGTDLHKGTYFRDTTVPLYAPFWVDGDCDTRTLSSTEPSDWLTRGVTTYDNTCHRNGQAYPNLIAQTLKAQQSIFVACSGAVTDNVGATEGVSTVTPKPQHPQSPVNVAGGNTQLTDVENFSGQRLGGNDPDVITIGIGGNDAGFGSVVGHCARPWVSDCEDGTTWADEVLSTINGDTFDRLVDTFTTLRDDFPSSTLLVFGYPTVIEPGATCGATAAYLDANETAFLGGTVLDALNAAVSDAAAQAGAYYVDISRVTQGHDVCSSDPWVNGLDFGFYGAGSGSFHPNVLAHQAISRYFTDHYTDGNGRLLVANPEPASTIRPAVGQSVHLATLDGTVQQACGAGCLQPAACVLTCQLEVTGGGFSPGANLQLTLHSDPVDLGTAVADADGQLDTVVTIPASVGPGVHWLAVDGTGPDGSAQEGTLAVNVYATPPPPLRVRPPAPGPAGGAGAVPRSHSRRRPVRVGVHVRRRGTTLTLRLTCPRQAASSCRVRIALQRVGRARHHRTLVTQRVVVGVGRHKRVTLHVRHLGRVRRSLRLHVTTTTAAGARSAVLSLPR